MRRASAGTDFTMFRPVLLLSAVTAALASPIKHAPNAQYDYIVVGGGTSGLVIANRLSENANVSVLVIEAGDSVLHNPNVTAVDGYGLAFGSDIDWQYQTVNQTYGGKSPQVMRAGKALSGTSAINGMAYTRAEDVQIDAWQQIGNEGWTWDSLFPYYLQSENLTIPSRSQRLEGATFNASYNGEQGPLTVGFGAIPANNLTATLNATFHGLGVPWSYDVNGGKMRGINIYPSTINLDANVREDAARAYYWPVASRPNLHLLLNTFANRIVWRGEARKGDVTAAGVEFSSANGTTTVVTARQEVIISAGSLKSPGILELSGIGNAALLKKHNITVQVNLPTVGENLQDQTNAHTEAATYSELTGTKYVVYPNVYDVYGNETISVAQAIRKQIGHYANATAEVSGGVMKASDLKDLFEVQYDLIFNQRVPIAEILYYPGTGATLASESWTLLPFARGNVHIASADPTAMPTINPNYYMFDWDLDSQIAVAKYIRDSFAAAPLGHLVKGMATPAPDVVAQDASDAEWKAWLFDGNYRSNFHPVGTAAMMPREKGGVVDTKLKVYGTTNVRVVDASVLPYQVCGHLVSTLYAVAERAAYLIKDESAFF
ncbi:GMC family oxidoreductase [Aspergillus homomorphus CBS 101889]|uniref:glucose oxidase n=1 Tax=Aspergillus homomorphus (strain CBS 101889) TaxID=1450537 RepID=A0A395I257_ASPHC|nr:alcohol oxidase [Aspergillus homomorphus CBS 101889]RAL12634.1 alcohol oxidase [Aspergillus homomorphus CBS 101889]